VAVSSALYAGVSSVFPGKAKLLPYGVRDDLFRPLSSSERNNLRKENKCNESDTVFIFLGSVGERKGFDLLAQAFSELAIDNPTWRLWIIGPS
ncbi:glycosyltransferase, partial [Escherichia coli]